MIFEPKLGSILMFEGDYRTIYVPIKNVTTISAVTQVLVQGSDTVTSTYITNNPTYKGNMMVSGAVGDKATMPAGAYRLFLTATYDGGKKRTWYLDITVIARDNYAVAHMIDEFDYNPVMKVISMNEGDVYKLEAVIPGITFSSVTSYFVVDGDDTDLEATYCTGTGSVDGSRLLSSSIGTASIPAGRYGYYMTAVYNSQKVTWCWLLNVSAKEAPL